MDQVTKMIKQPEPESEQSKQLLSNFQTKKILRLKTLGAEVKNWVAYKKHVMQWQN